MLLEVFMSHRRDSWSRRQFLERLTLAGTAGLFSMGPEAAAAEPPPETTRLRLYKFPGICLAPQYMAEALLRAEGFTEVEYLAFPEGAKGVYDRVGSGAVDITQWYLAPFIVAADKKAPILFLSGVHVGCQELVATGRIRSISDLKGKTVAAPVGGALNSFVVAILGHVGLDYRKDVNFIEKTPGEAIQLLAEGKVDAFLATPPFGQELRAKKIGHVIVNMATDRPWSQYFCCMLVGNREFVRKHPVATKRAMRAILKADQICALEPERVARNIVDRGFTKSYEYALQTMKDVPYGRWRQYDPEDAVRFYALRLHEAGVIESTPQKIIAESTDWRILNELKKELKG
jgi:NitT/TauT family transport system substrate-binding protein